MWKKQQINIIKKISVCGEMAGDLKGIVALLSLGIKDLSMVESSILSAKSLVRGLEYKTLENIRENNLKLWNRRASKKYFKRVYKLLN